MKTYLSETFKKYSDEEKGKEETTAKEKASQLFSSWMTNMNLYSVIISWAMFFLSVFFFANLEGTKDLRFVIAFVVLILTFVALSPVRKQKMKKKIDSYIREHPDDSVNPYLKELFEEKQ